MTRHYDISEFSPNVMLDLRYNGKLRSGRVKTVNVERNTVCLNLILDGDQQHKEDDGIFKSFSTEKMTDVVWYDQ